MLALTTPLLLAFAASEALARKASGSSPQPASPRTTSRHPPPTGPPAAATPRERPNPLRHDVRLPGGAAHPDFSAAILRRVIPRRPIS